MVKGKQTFDKIKKTVTILLAIFFVATVTATSVSAKTVDVSIEGNSFKPSSVEISKDDYVKWTNKDKIEHTVEGTNFILYSNHIHPGQSFEYQFILPGTYDYKCSLHPTMKGTVKLV